VRDTKRAPHPPHPAARRMGTCPCTIRPQGHSGVIPVSAVSALKGGNSDKSMPTNGCESSPTSNVLVTGATGLLGRQVMRVFEAKGWNLRGLAFSRAKGSLVKCDLFDSLALAAQFAEFRPQIVVHCAAERRPDSLEADREYAMRINEGVVRSVSELCKEHGSWLIYLSTNYVFDGTAAPYAEDAVPKPLNVYGESKRRGELALQEVLPEAAIVRVPLLHGPIEKLGETSVDELLNLIRDGARKFDNWQERYPTNVEDLALILERFATTKGLAKKGGSDPALTGGVFHWQSKERHTKYTMALAIAEMAGIDANEFVAVDTAPPEGSAPRPQFERMLCTRLETLLRIDGQSQAFRSDFKESMRRHLTPFV